MKKDTIIIVGAGLSGSLLALLMAQKGYIVRLYEKRPDMRTVNISAGRSINLALSHRGLMALDRVGLRNHVLDNCVPMHGRKIHGKDGRTFFSRYSGREGEHINSVSRGGLNILLINELDKYENVRVVFDAKCVSVKLETGIGRFRNNLTGEIFEDKGDILIGTDGAGSAVRRSLMGNTTDLLFNFSQNFLRHGYKELTMLPNDDGGYKMEKNALHIWPRGEFMMIALPNLDGSFTLTLFQRFSGGYGFKDLDDRREVKTFFEEQFPDLVPLIPHYLEEFFENPVGTLGTIKCYPWQAHGRVCMMGDAAHAIVPFYGQGMNASFEDVRVFDDLLGQMGDNNWLRLFESFQDIRVENTDAIADLAIDNFHEMQDKVDDSDFRLKRTLERRLEDEFANYYSKYSLVTFKPELAYREAMVRGRAQDKILLDIISRTPDIDMLDLQKVLEEIELRIKN